MYTKFYDFFRCTCMSFEVKVSVTVVELLLCTTFLDHLDA